ncbi:MAG: hypothetical protein EP343_21870 [Deltaproteobacteria bacterium]|nr:MAG: hypothetical protein EP343_21870 [Deltaproteobacteria bacterium]
MRHSRWWPIAWIGILLWGASMVGCSTQPTPCKDAGCACQAPADCNTGLECTNGTCTQPGTQPPADSGNPPQNNNNTVTPPPDGTQCTPGQPGCRCTPTGTCETGLRCNNGLCQVCPEGTAGCSCKKDNTCSGGLQCDAGVCTGCVGKDQCPCYGNNSCDVGNRCNISNTGISLCQACNGKDMIGCNCMADKDCGGGSIVCVNRRCLDLQKVNDIPKEPLCYFPCQSPIKLSDGTIKDCHADYKLASGCPVGQQCRQGSCLLDAVKQPASQDYPFCKVAADCPKWQTCLHGRCYSTCRSPSQCPSGFQCHYYVCRRKCNTRTSTCQQFESCTTNGADDGVCMPKSVRTTQSKPQSTTSGTFDLPQFNFEFTRNNSAQDIHIINRSTFPASFTLQRLRDDTGSTTPLFWLKFDRCKTYDANRTTCTEFEGRPSAADPFKLDNLEPNKKYIVRISNAQGKPQEKNVYNGTLLLRNADMGTKEITLSYREKVDGQWRGTMVAFGNFNENKDQMKKFPNTSSLEIRSIPNALLQNWVSFKRNNIPFEQFLAALRSMREGTWAVPRLAQDCKRIFSEQNSQDVVCYPYIDPAKKNHPGMEVLSYSQSQAPVPSGASELSLVLNIKEDNGTTLSGRIDSSQTLQYPGDPAISIAFAEALNSKPLIPLTKFESTIDIGGNYEVGPNETCKNNKLYRKVSFPWLVPGFEMGTAPQVGGLFRTKSACQMYTLPQQAPTSATEDQKKAIERLNMSLSSSNPIPNGWRLRRRLEFVDGAMIRNRYFFVIYRERFVSFFKANSTTQSALTSDFVNYGYILLTRTDNAVAQEDFTGQQPLAQTTCTTDGDCASGKTCQAGVCREPDQLKQVSCSTGTVQKAINVTITDANALNSWTNQRLNDLVSVLLTGQTSQTSSSMKIDGQQVNGTLEYFYQDTEGKHYIHYYCEDTGQFDGGSLSSAQSCPAGSKVTYFSLLNVSTSSIRSDACQDQGTCAARLQQLKFSNKGYRENVPYQCKGGNNLFCDDPTDLRIGKLFFRKSTPGQYVSPFAEINNAMFQAFRYRLKFVSRTGKNIGFAPDICQSGTSGLTPYCYDPKVIEEIEQRVNCLEYIFASQTLSNKLDTTLRRSLRDFLTNAFSVENKISNGNILTSMGFETLNAELKVMLGDEAYTRSFASRYDLANTRQIAFQGVDFEPNGINLSGALGFEMHNLYLSVQYYQMVLDRFFSQASTLRRTFQGNDTAFITVSSITSYFQKLLLASTRKARSLSQISKRYHQLNRPDLAQQVLYRSYAATYMEMTILTRLLQELMFVLKKEQLAQVRQEIDKISFTYKAALLDMEETYKQLQLSINNFGLPPNTIPFPALDRFSSLTGTTNAFQFALQFAKEKMFIARNKEQVAIQDKRTFDTNAASFQNELVRIERNFENQLADLCGRITVTDPGGEVRQYPAIPKYANLSPQTSTLPNPCGSIPGGAIYNALLDVEKMKINVLSIKKSQESLNQQITLERDRIRKYCDAKFQLASITLGAREQQHNLQLEIEQTQRDIEQTIRITQQLTQAAEMIKCSFIAGTATGGDCITAAVAAIAIVGLGAAQEVAVKVQENNLKKKREELLRNERLLEQTQIQFECRPCDVSQPTCTQQGTAQIESNIKIKELTSSLLNLHYEAQKAQFDLRIASSNIIRLQQQARLLQTQQNEATQLAINVQAAQNDPNVRIYKNDAIISAERTFQDAIREAYRATLIYEYYTGTSYKKKGDLYLIRMIAYGDKNLEAYLSDLEQAFRDFEETNSKPDIRVAVLSLRDDILGITRQVETPGGEVTRTLGDRIAEFQKILSDRNNLNTEGYTAFPFNVNVSIKDSLVSPITFNHKVLYIEAEIVGGELGDDVGRLYLRAKGTGVVRLKGGDIKYHTLPVRTAVINPFFNGTKVFTPEIYRNFRLRDYPLGNTQWELLINQVSEKVNQDINLNAVDDIRLYLYYTDFTEEK